MRGAPLFLALRVRIEDVELMRFRDAPTRQFLMRPSESVKPLVKSVQLICFHLV